MLANKPDNPKLPRQFAFEKLKIFKIVLTWYFQNWPVRSDPTHLWRGAWLWVCLQLKTGISPEIIIRKVLSAEHQAMAGLFCIYWMFCKESKGAHSSILPSSFPFPLIFEGAAEAD